jgi:hypothetical protein
MCSFVHHLGWTKCHLWLRTGTASDPVCCSNASSMISIPMCFVTVSPHAYLPVYMVVFCILSVYEVEFQFEIRDRWR